MLLLDVEKTYISSHFLIYKYSAASWITQQEGGREAEDILVCDEVLLIHSNDEWMAYDLFCNWNLLLTQPVSMHSYPNFSHGKKQNEKKKLSLSYLII